MQEAHQGDSALHFVQLWVTDDRIYHFAGIISLTQSSISEQICARVLFYINNQRNRKNVK